MLDLYNKKYDRETLKRHIYEVKLLDILKTQELDLFFIVRYILSDLYQLHEEDKLITVDTVLQYQPHINKDELQKTLDDYDSDDDSFGDFQTYSDRI